jgi:hypothetical protein
MCKLYGSFGVLAMNEIRDTLQRQNLAVLPEPGILWTDAATRLDRSGLNEDKTSTLKGKLAEVNKMEICQMTIFGRVCTHRRNNKAVLELNTTSAEGLEESRCRLGLERSSGRRFLSRREVRNAGGGLVLDIVTHDFFLMILKWFCVL